MKKVIYNEFTNEHSVHVVKYLQDKYAWEPVYLFGINPSAIQGYLSDNKFDCILDDSMNLRQAQFDYTKIGEPIPVDAEILDKLSKYAINNFGIVQDTSGWNFSYNERKQFYYDMLKYWNTLLIKMKPDLVVFFTWPHSSSCYALYLLCKYHYDIEILFIDPSPLFDCNYHFVGTTLEQLHAPFMELYKSNETLIPGKDVNKYLSKTRSEFAKIPTYVTEIYKRDKKTKVKLIKQFIKLVLLTCIKGTGFKIVPIDFKKNRKHYTDLKARLNNFEYIILLERMRRDTIKLEKIYKKFCIEPNYKMKYLYFAAPYQPEAVTATNAGVYDELFLVLDILSSSIPNDWIIYYKEHPATFLEHYKGVLRRDRDYYEKVMSYENIKLVSSEVDAFELIDNSQAVATVAGTSGWESAVRGKPVLAFGSVWYQGCESIFTINTLKDAQEALSKICDGYCPDNNDIDRYAAAVERIATKGIVMENFHQEINKVENSKHEMERIANIIYEAYEREYM